MPHEPRSAIILKEPIVIFLVASKILSGASFQRSGSGVLNTKLHYAGTLTCSGTWKCSQVRSNGVLKTMESQLRASYESLLATFDTFYNMSESVRKVNTKKIANLYPC